MKDFFGFQDRSDMEGKSYFVDEYLRVIAKRYDFRSENLGENPVIECMNTQAAPQERVQANVRYLYELIQDHSEGPFRVPFLVLVPVKDGKPDYHHAVPKDGLADGKTIESIIEKTMQDYETFQRKFRR